MQQQIRVCLCIFLSVVAASCKKIELNVPGTATLTIINTVKGTSSLATNFNGTGPLVNYYLNARKLTYNTALSDNRISSYSGSVQLGLYNYPDTLPKSTPLLLLSLELPVGSIHSLFVTGTVTAPDTMYINDHIPSYPTSDSTTGIRFINLAQGSDPVSINLEGQAPGSEINALGYKQVTGFMRYPATAAVSSYTFECRDAATGELLASYTAEGINNNSSDPNNRINKWRFRNSTLALVANSDDTKTLLLINNY